MALPNTGLAEVGSLIGDPARANMLAALADGRACTATELAHVAGVAPQTASGHLARLVHANLLRVARQGRHRYYRLAAPLVGELLESMMTVAAMQLPPRRVPAPCLDAAMRTARTCYDHLAGRLGVAIADALVARGHVVLSDEGGAVTARGEDFFAAFGVTVARPGAARRPFCRPCLDWSERRWHIAGAVGCALCARLLALEWIARRPGTRAVAITPAGQRGLTETFGIALAADATPQPARRSVQ